MNVLDLFSGIGGFSLGLERAGMRTVAFCEIDPYCRRVLAKHWPDVPVYDDVRTLTAARLVADAAGIDEQWSKPERNKPRRPQTAAGNSGIDVICGGFPCQDISASPARAQALPASALAYGKSTPELLGRFDPATRSLKTSQLCFLEGSETFSSTFPRSGTMRNGTVYVLPMLVPHTGGTGLDRCLPTASRRRRPATTSSAAARRRRH